MLPVSGLGPAEKMVSQELQFKTCFVSAPRGLRLNALRESLLSHGVRPLIPQQLGPGTDWASEIQRELVRADFVIGVLPTGHQPSWVLFELGQAWALGKQILLIASPKSEPVPFALQRVLVLRIALNNREAIDFALDQLLSAKPESPADAPRQPFASPGLGTQADLLLEQLDRSLESGDSRDLERIARNALQNSGTDIVVESPRRDRGADLAAWSDVLEPFVGNPLLIEVKRKIEDAASAERSFEQLKRYLGASGARWALLLYGQGPLAEDRIWKHCPHNVLLMPLRSLIEALRTRAFPEVVRDLRNRRVHSVRP